MKPNRTYLVTVAMATLALVLVAPMAADADDYQNSDGGTTAYSEDNSEPPDAVSSPDVPGGTTGVQCESAGWKFRASSHSNSFLTKETFSYTNADYNITKTFNFGASRSTTSEYSVSVGVSATAGSAMFGELQASINASVKKSLSYGVNYGGSTPVPPRSVSTAKLGFKRTSAYGQSFYLDSSCGKKYLKSATIKAPWQSAWWTSTSHM
jgi:hypothetical protein